MLTTLHFVDFGVELYDKRFSFNTVADQLKVRDLCEKLRSYP